MGKTLSIIIPCYNAEKTISKCLQSIFQSANKLSLDFTYEIIVINDGSSDQTLSIINNVDGIKVINHNKNLGLSSARNTGIQESDSKYIVFIDSDIVLSENWIHNMLTLIIKHDDIMGITGNLEARPENKNKTLDGYLFGKYRGTKEISLDKPLNYKFFVFSNTIIKRSVLNAVGNFDNILKNYGGEDTELAIRIHKKYSQGMRKLTTVNAYHITHKTLDKHLNDIFEYGKYNFHKIIQKHPTYKVDLGYNWIVSFWTNFLFNSLSVLICKMLLKKTNNPLLIKFLVINSFIKGARSLLL